MFYNKRLKTKQLSLKQLSFSSFKNGINTEHDQHITPVNISRNTYNFNFQNGALKTGLGFEDLTVPYSEFYKNDIKTITLPPNLIVYGTWLYNAYDQNSKRYEATLLMYCSDKRIYYNILNTGMTVLEYIPGFYLNEIPNVINYKLNGRDVVIFTNQTDGMFVWHFGMFTPMKVEDAPNIKSMCVHAERLFATVSGPRSEVWFSDDLDPTNWSVSLNEAGFIQMADERGPLNKVISLNDYVYVFREYGISRIVAYGNQQDFAVTHQYFSNSKIYENTVCACGDIILFLAKDGIYAFNGISATKLKLNFENMLEPNDSALATYHNGKYYLATRLNFNDDKIIGSEEYDNEEDRTNNALIELDIKTGDINILRGVDVVSLNSINNTLFSRLVVCSRSKVYVRMGQLAENGAHFEFPTKKYWQSPETDLGYSSNDKILKELYVKNHYDFTFTVTTENQTKSFTVPKNKGITKLKLNIKGRVFTFAFSTNNKEAYISNPKIIYGVL